MYEKTETHLLNASVSNLFDNLDVLVEDNNDKGIGQRVSLACVNQFEINFVHCNFGVSSSTSKIIVEKSEEMKSIINEARWCRLEKQDVFVVANYEGVLVYDARGAMMMFWHGIQPKKDDLDFNLFCRGITCVRSKYICVGSSTGEVFIITPHKSSFQLLKTRHDHDVAITSLSATDHPSYEVNFVSGDEKGAVFCYNFSEEGSISNVSQSTSDGIPCTSVKIADNNMVIAGYMTGYIDLINSLNGVKLARINAHARILTSLDVTRKTSNGNVYVISASEDTFIRVWEISNTTKLQVKQIWSHTLHDVQPCGVKFCDQQANSFLTSCYDSKEVLQFSRV